MNAIPRVVRNDWSTVRVPELAGWRPTRSFSVIIPAYRCHATLDRTLAALSRQTYPAELLEVVVVDDGSDPALTLPPLRPERTALVRVESGWGRANALACGVRHSTGEILHWLDADMVAFPEHVAAQARWHHVLPYAVTLGYERFVDGPWPAPEACLRPEALFAGGEPHHYVERYIAQTNQLRMADHLAFRIHVGATAAVSRALHGGRRVRHRAAARRGHRVRLPAGPGRRRVRTGAGGPGLAPRPDPGDAGRRGGGPLQPAVLRGPDPVPPAHPERRRLDRAAGRGGHPGRR
ncbi:glycosyltransferase family 2 protein [Asanoa sp. NPDC050611]|uniref:glycosyltransferase family 2 protein n=1 Tax=Asanoa sp. NPDC050611 TaxID=3157098 RepID=UPI0034064A55